MPYYQRKRRLYVLWEKLRRSFLIVIGLGALGGLWWWLSTIGPRKVSDDDLSPAGVVGRENWDELIAEIDALEAEFDRAGSGDPAGMEALRTAIAKQEELLRRAPAQGRVHAARQAELERKLANAQATAKSERIVELEKVADEFWAADNLEDSREVLEQALVLQREINSSAADSARRSFAKETRLLMRIEEVNAAPLAGEVESALTLARLAVAEERWGAALAGFTSALDIQRRINTEFARSGFSDTLRVTRIEQEIDSLNATELVGEITANIEAAETAEAAADFAEAGAMFEAARDLQVRVNQQFPRSRFLSSAAVEELEGKRQSVLSAPTGQELAGLEQEISRLLRERQVLTASERIQQAHTLVESWFEDYPKSDRLRAALRLKFAYLNSQVERLAEIQDAVYARLRPLPGVAERRMLRTEFPQSLYLQIMNTNPSRRTGRAFPVDSVNWFDARQCAERLGWLLGRSVDLPTLDEYRIALGAQNRAVPRRDDGDEGSGEMAATPANDGGFFELIGNLSEWLRATESRLGGDPAQVAGGSYLDAGKEVAPGLVVEIARAERARHLGFRVVVDMNAEP